MEPYLAKACRRAAIRLVGGGVVLITVVGLRIVTATPRGIEGEIAELERFEAQGASDPTTESGERGGVGPGRVDADEPLAAASPDAVRPRGVDPDPDRLVRCHFAAQSQFMRAADCQTRGGLVEERPRPSPEPTDSAHPDR
jgi:hypothetical protein